jgi:hypothetical protein
VHAQLGQSGGPSARELVQPLIFEHRDHLVGILDPQGIEPQPLRGNRHAYS